MVGDAVVWVYFVSTPNAHTTQPIHAIDATGTLMNKVALSMKAASMEDLTLEPFFVYNALRKRKTMNASVRIVKKLLQERKKGNPEEEKPLHNCQKFGKV
jgi:hypothetical protein